MSLLLGNKTEDLKAMQFDIRRQRKSIMQHLTVIVPTYNEEINLQKCLKSLIKLAATIYVVDSGSNDKTTEIAKAFVFFFNDTATTEIYTLSLHDALPI